jgi:hypothetical protein
VHNFAQGDKFYYVFGVHNNTSELIAGLTVEDPLPQEVLSFGMAHAYDSKGNSLGLEHWSYSPQTHAWTSTPFDLKPGEAIYWYLEVWCSEDSGPFRPVTNTAMLGPLGLQGIVSIHIELVLSPIVVLAAGFGGGFDVGKKDLEVGGANLAPPKTASGPVILVDGIAERTVPDQGHPDAILIAPKSAKKIKPGQTVTIQVQFPDGSTTNSISYTRPTG